MLGSLSRKKIKRTWSLPLKIYNIGGEDPTYEQFYSTRKECVK